MAAADNEGRLHRLVTVKSRAKIAQAPVRHGRLTGLFFSAVTCPCSLLSAPPYSLRKLFVYLYGPYDKAVKEATGSGTRRAENQEGACGEERKAQRRCDCVAKGQKTESTGHTTHPRK